MSDSSVIYSLCGMCNTRCPIEVHCEGGKPRWVCGNHTVPSKQGLCPRGAAGIALYNDTERPQGPLIRVGERGEGKWRSASWDEALTYVAEKLQKVIDEHGARSILFSERGGTYSDMSKAFMRAIGSPNYCTHDAACAHNVNNAAFSVTGMGRKKWVYDFKNAKHIIVQGRNLFEALKVGEVNDVLGARAKGAKLTSVDVRPTMTGARATTAMIIRPGTDYAFNLAIIHTLIEEKLYNAAFVEEFVKDFDYLCEFVRPYSPEWAEEECSIPAASIRELAREVAKDAPNIIWHGGWMSTRYTQSLMVCRTAYLINALLGSFGAKGGIINSAGPKDCDRNGLQSLTKLYPAPEEKRVDGVGWREPKFFQGSNLLHRAFKAMKTHDPYPIKAYIAMKHDPLTAMPDPKAQKELFKELDLLVSVTFSWSDTAWYSDVVLPMHTFLEQDSLLLQQGGLKPKFVMQRAAAKPLYGTKADWWIFGHLAQKLGKDQLLFNSSKDLWNYQLDGTGVSIRDFCRNGIVTLTDTAIKPAKPKFATESGKIEVIFAPWEAAGIASLRPYEPVRRPQSTDEFRLIVGRNARHTHGHTQNNPLLHQSQSINSAWIAQSRAEALNLQEGDTIIIRSAQGDSGKLAVRVVEGMAPDALFMLHGYGHALPVETRAQGLGVADQEFMRGGLEIEDATGHGVALQEHFVRIEKVADDAAKAE